MFNVHFVTAFYKDLAVLLCAATLTVSNPEPAAVSGPAGLSNLSEATISQTAELWRYLRKGINYLESSGKEIPTHSMHKGAVAYGPLALSPIAIEDVKRHNPSLAGVSTEEVLLDKGLYERFAFLYADLLLKHYLKVDYPNMDKKEVFNILEKAWFLGPSLYLEGHPVISSRESKAAEYVNGDKKALL